MVVIQLYIYIWGRCIESIMRIILVHFIVVLFYIFLQQPLPSDVFSLFSQISHFYKEKDGVGFLFGFVVGFGLGEGFFFSFSC